MPRLIHELRDFLAILIVDGHKSSECPIAIKMTNNHNRGLFIKTDPTSYVSQLFDVGIGSFMKYFFTKLFPKEMVNIQTEIYNLSQYHFLCILYSQTIYKSYKDIVMNISICSYSVEPLLSSIL